MSAAKHTPGPWIRQQWPDGSHTIAHGATLGTIATMFPGDDEREQADARVIAAAPDLIALAIRVEALLTRQRWLPDGTDPESELLRDARAVIAKAGGAES